MEFLNSDLLKELGTAGLLFGCFYLSQQQTAKNIEALINQQRDFIDKNFLMLKGMLDCNFMNTSLLQEIKDKIDTNTWCPYSRKFISKIGEQENE